MNIIGILIGVAIIVGLVAAMAKMSDHGVDANGCSGNCKQCGVPSELRDCVPEQIQHK